MNSRIANALDRGAATRSTGAQAPPARPLPPGTTVGWFTTKEKAGRALWYLVQGTIFRWSLRRADRWRSFLLRCFGAKVGRACLIRNTVHVEVPWNLTMGDRVWVGDRVVIYDLGPITIGDRSMVSQHSYLCGGTHDHTRSDLPLLRVPIVIGADVWIAADVFVGPGVTIGDGVLVGARSSVFSDLPPWKICVGNPARPIKEREYARVD